MLEDIKKKYEINFSINPKIAKTSTHALIHEMYKSGSVLIFNSLLKRKDFESNFKFYLDNTKNNYEFNTQSYEMLLLTQQAINQFKINVEAEKWLNLMLTNNDYRSKVYLAEKIITENILNVNKDMLIQTFQHTFKNFDWDINLDLLFKIPVIKNGINENAISLVNLLMLEDSRDINVSNTHYVLRKLYNEGYTYTCEQTIKSLKTYLHSFEKTGGYLNAYFNLNGFFKVIEELKKFTPNIQLSNFLKEQFSHFSMKSSMIEEITIKLHELEKDELECSLNSPTQPNKKIKI